MSNEPLSNCHQAPMTVSSSDEGTNNYVCTECGNYCDQYVAMPNKQTDPNLSDSRPLKAEADGEDSLRIQVIDAVSQGRIIHESQIVAVEQLIQARERVAERRGIKKGIIRTTSDYSYTVPMKSMRTRNTAFKLYAVKFFNSRIKERRQALLQQLRQEVKPIPINVSKDEYIKLAQSVEEIVEEESIDYGGGNRG